MSDWIATFNAKRKPCDDLATNFGQAEQAVEKADKAALEIAAKYERSPDFENVRRPEASRSRTPGPCRGVRFRRCNGAASITHVCP